MNIEPTTIQNLINNYGSPFESSYEGSGRFRSSLALNQHMVIDDIIPNKLAKTIDNSDKQYYVGYNGRGELCYALAPIGRPKVSGRNYLMCRLYGTYPHYIREATTVEMMASFEGAKSGSNGIINLSNFRLGHGVISLENQYDCYVESDINCNWHKNRLVTDNIMVEGVGVVYFKNSTDSNKKIKSEIYCLDFEGSTFAKITNMLSGDECLVRVSYINNY
jgi:hypothetical protein